MKFSSELLKGATKNIILSVLSRQEMYGYEIVKTIREQSDDLLTLGEGSLYPALHELEKRKYVTSRWVTSEHGRERKYYKITRRGQKNLEVGVKEWKTFSRILDTLYPSIDVV